MKIIEYLKRRINENNREKLTNLSPTLVCSNCTGGFIYHWLGLKFNSPFINLYLSDVDFVKALKQWDRFLSSKIIEDKTSSYSYPVGTTIDGIKIHFMHYNSFEEAIEIWERRKQRIDNSNMGVMLTNWGGGQESVIRDFEELPFKNKVAFVNREIPNTECTFVIKGKKDLLNLHRTQKLNGRRFIDQFDYVSFINGLTK